MGISIYSTGEIKNSALPAFSAYQSSAQTVSTNTWTKIQFQTEEFDTASCFDNTTNYRFTPNVAGYYQVSGCISTVALNTGSQVQSAIYKNGSVFKIGTYVTAYGAVPLYLPFSALIYFNGSTDYVEAYINQNGTNGNMAVGAAYTYFQASMVRAA